MEKKQIKISLGTFIAIIVAIILVVVVVFMGIHIANQNKQIEESKVAVANNETNEKTELSTKENINDEINTDNSSIEVKDEERIKVENGGAIEDWHYGYNDEDVAKLINNKYSIQNKGDKVYLKVNEYTNNREDIGWLYDWTSGEYLINGILSKDIKKSLVGIALREQEEYVVLIFIKNNGEVYYCSNYLNGMDNSNIARKLNVNDNFVDAKQGYYSYIDDEFATTEYGRDIILIDKNGKKYSFEVLQRYE